MEDNDIMSGLSVRNLETGQVRSPLREFKGRLEGVRREHNEQYNRDSNHLSFVEVEVIESIEPYDFPIAELTFSASNRTRSLWGIFGTTLVKLLADGEDLKDTIGRVYHLKVTPGHMLPSRDPNTNKWTDTERDAWEVIGLEGKAAVKPSSSGATEEALRILDGKTTSQFNAAALSNPAVRADPKVQSAIMGKTFIRMAVDAGMVTVDADGIHHLN